MFCPALFSRQACTFAKTFSEERRSKRSASAQHASSIACPCRIAANSERQCRRSTAVLWAIRRRNSRHRSSCRSTEHKPRRRQHHWSAGFRGTSCCDPVLRSSLGKSHHFMNDYFCSHNICRLRPSFSRCSIQQNPARTRQRRHTHGCRSHRIWSPMGLQVMPSATASMPTHSSLLEGLKPLRKTLSSPPKSTSLLLLGMHRTRCSFSVTETPVFERSTLTSWEK